ncbi:MAG: chromate efflux transporter [Chitinophagaceae bacterium]|nr:chromate efflux transporter [Oligoflexus sp.]
MFESLKSERSHTNQDLWDLILLFLRLGTTAFGGPAAHIAMMQDEVVRRKQWLTRDEFLDLLGATNLMPGPNSTEMAIHIGHKRAGWMGLVLAGVAFILPATLIVTACAWAYVKYGSTAEARSLAYGIKPVIIAVVLQALWSLSKTAVKTWTLLLIGSASFALNCVGVSELTVLFASGLTMLVLHSASQPKLWDGASPLIGTSILGNFWAQSAALTASAAGSAMSFSLGALFLAFAKIGAVLFGSGYVLIAFIRADLVEKLHWLTESQLLDAVAVGQVTPGPVFTTATFIGYLLAGNAGAFIATVGIFLPAFLFVAASVIILPKLRKSSRVGAFLDGLNVASLALMAVVTLQLLKTAVIDPFTAVLAITSAFLLIRYKLNSVWLVIGGAISGFLFGHYT